MLNEIHVIPVTKKSSITFTMIFLLLLFDNHGILSTTLICRIETTLLLLILLAIQQQPLLQEPPAAAVAGAARVDRRPLLASFKQALTACHSDIRRGRPVKILTFL